MSVNAARFESRLTRDQVFLIDNSASMRQHRKEVRDLLEHLVYMVKDSDPDGVELISWMSKIKQRFRHTTGLLDAFDKMRFEGESNIRAPLLEILKDYQTKLQNGGTSGNRWSMSSRPVQVRPQNVYIFTDAIWQPACEAGGIIRGMVVMLERYGVHKEDFGIQFIRFGDDPTGIARLNHLDAGLGLSMYGPMTLLPPQRFDYQADSDVAAGISSITNQRKMAIYGRCCSVQPINGSIMTRLKMTVLATPLSRPAMAMRQPRL